MIKAEIESEELQRELNALGKQVPFAIARALTKTAQAAQAYLEVQTPRIFDRPTRYTRRAFRVIPAKKTALRADVKVKDEATKGTPASKYLEPQVEGGARRRKRFEAALESRGRLFGAERLVPGKALRLDQYGNVPRRLFNPILSQVKGQRDKLQDETAASRKRKSRSRKRGGRYFMGRPGGGRQPLGVWERIETGFGSAVRPILLAFTSVDYRPRFQFDRLVRKVYDRDFLKYLRESMRIARETARK